MGTEFLSDKPIVKELCATMKKCGLYIEKSQLCLMMAHIDEETASINYLQADSALLRQKSGNFYLVLATANAEADMVQVSCAPPALVFPGPLAWEAKRIFALPARVFSTRPGARRGAWAIRRKPPRRCLPNSRAES